MGKTLRTKLVLFLAITLLVNPFLHGMRHYHKQRKSKRRKYKNNKHRYHSKKERKFKNKTRKQKKKLHIKKERILEISRKKVNKFLHALSLGTPFFLSCFLRSVATKSTTGQDVVDIEECIPGRYNLIIRNPGINTWMGQTSCFCIQNPLYLFIFRKVEYLKCGLFLREPEAIKDYDAPCEPGIYDVYVDYVDRMLRTTRACTCRDFGDYTVLGCGDNPSADYEEYPHEDFCDDYRRHINTDSERTCKTCYLPPSNSTTVTNTKPVTLCNPKEASSNPAPIIAGTAIGSSALTFCCILGAVVIGIAGVVICYKIRKSREKRKLPKIEPAYDSSEQATTSSESSSDSDTSSDSCIEDSSDFDTSSNVSTASDTV